MDDKSTLTDGEGEGSDVAETPRRSDRIKGGKSKYKVVTFGKTKVSSDSESQASEGGYETALGELHIESDEEVEFKHKKRGKYNDLKPAKLISDFLGEPGEARYFIKSFRVISFSANWSESFKRQVFESKLKDRARKTYFRGLGQVDDIPMEQRIKRFLAIFSPSVDPDEMREKFDSCYQEKGESVAAYRARLEALAKPLKASLATPAQLDRALAYQFKKGIKEELKTDLYKSTRRSFSALYDLALHYEQVFVRLNPKRLIKVNTVTDEEEIPLTTKPLTKYRQPTKPKEGSSPLVFYCTKCRMPGHSDQQCRKAATIKCFRCNKLGHTSRVCTEALPAVNIIICEHCNKTGHKKEGCFQLLYSNNVNLQNKDSAGNEGSLRGAQ